MNPNQMYSGSLGSGGAFPETGWAEQANARTRAPTPSMFNSAQSHVQQMSMWIERLNGMLNRLRGPQPQGVPDSALSGGPPTMALYMAAISQGEMMIGKLLEELDQQIGG